ncbi:MAG: hypothetical protein JNL65_07620 [Saprospiraceae bacterium]|nr:hypothetical protein [Saprospiraceae bacterium]
MNKYPSNSFVSNTMRLLANFSSYIFHPLLVLFYSLFLLLCLNPHLFGSMHWSEQSLLLILLFIYTCLVPAIGFALLRFTGFIQSFEMRERTDRFGPLIICAVFYLWMYVNLKSQEQIPRLMICFILASIISIFLAFAINTKVKISLHSIAFGAFIAFWVLLRFNNLNEAVLNFRFIKTGLSAFNVNHLIAISCVLGGWIGTCRLYLKAHTAEELYLGYLVGIISSILAFSYIF